LFAYQHNQRYFAQIAEGLEDLGAAELQKLGAVGIRCAFRGLHFEADPAALYRINYQSRLVTRVLAPLATFPCHSTDSLYRQARQIPWKAILNVDQTLAVFANLSKSRIRHSQYAALCLKDAVVDYFREDSGRRPDVRRIDPDVGINLFIENDRAVISLDTSGGSLHRRGYRREGVDASMQETVAAAIIQWTEWSGSRPLVDPMCGSGTLLAEALMHCCRIPAAFLRQRFGFEQLPDFDRSLWTAVKISADRNIRPLPAGLIAGSDVAAQAVASARANLQQLPHGATVPLERLDYRRRRDLAERVIVCNPPYGLRLQPQADLAEFYRTLGDFLKRRCAGAEAYLYFGNRDMLKHIGLKPAWKRPLKNGGIDGRLVKFALYGFSGQSDRTPAPRPPPRRRYRATGTNSVEPVERPPDHLRARPTAALRRAPAASRHSDPTPHSDPGGIR
jgi:putative N6-adenine-specific DNA methylase